MRESVLEMIKLLRWLDFETLVDLVFTSSGWRRVGTVGGDQEMVDFALELPSTKERVS
jgi:hypothetical protein